MVRALSFRRPLLACAMAAALVSFALVSSASADVIDPDEEACWGVKKGEACKSPSTGTCEPAECCKLDYSNRDDAGAPGTKCSDCLKCKAGGSPDASGAPEDTGSAADTGAGTDTGAGVSADAGGGSKTSASTYDDSGCTVGGHTVPWTTIVSLIAGLLGVLVLRRRRA